MCVMLRSCSDAWRVRFPAAWSSGWAAQNRTHRVALLGGGDVVASLALRAFGCRGALCAAVHTGGAGIWVCASVGASIWVGAAVGPSVGAVGPAVGPAVGAVAAAVPTVGPAVVASIIATAVSVSIAVSVSVAITITVAIAIAAIAVATLGSVGDCMQDGGREKGHHGSCPGAAPTRPLSAALLCGVSSVSWGSNVRCRRPPTPRTAPRWGRDPSRGAHRALCP